MTTDKPSEAEVGVLIRDILVEMTSDWDLELDGIGPQTLLLEDLCFSSVDAMELGATIDMRVGRKLPYELLFMKDNEYVSDVSVGALTQFVHTNYEFEAPGPVAM